MLALIPQHQSTLYNNGTSCAVDKFFDIVKRDCFECPGKSKQTPVHNLI
jgi:hypothetical protein